MRTARRRGAPARAPPRPRSSTSAWRSRLPPSGQDTPNRASSHPLRDSGRGSADMRGSAFAGGFGAMSTSITRPKVEPVAKTERPRAYKVILLNDDYTPRDFVVTVLRAVFRMSTDQARGVMLTAHRR